MGSETRASPRADERYEVRTLFVVAVLFFIVSIGWSIVGVSANSRGSSVHANLNFSVAALSLSTSVVLTFGALRRSKTVT